MLNDTSVFPVAFLENAVTRPIAYQGKKYEPSDGIAEGAGLRFETTPEPLQGSVLRGSQYDAKTRQDVTSSIGHTWRFFSILNRNGNRPGVRTYSEIRQHFGK